MSKILSVASRSPNNRYKTGAIIVDRHSDIVSDGWAHVGFSLKELYSCHAEIHALNRARHLNLYNHTCYIVTLRERTGRVVMSRPCLTCAVALRAAGIVTCFYSLDGCLTDGIEWASLDLSGDLSTLKRYKRPDDAYSRRYAPRTVF